MYIRIILSMSLLKIRKKYAESEKEKLLLVKMLKRFRQTFYFCFSFLSILDSIEETLIFMVDFLRTLDEFLCNRVITIRQVVITRVRHTAR